MPSCRVGADFASRKHASVGTLRLLGYGYIFRIRLYECTEPSRVREVQGACNLHRANFRLENLPQAPLWRISIRLWQHCIMGINVLCG